MNTEQMRHLVNRHSWHKSDKKENHFWCIIQCRNVYIVMLSRLKRSEVSNLAITHQCLRGILAKEFTEAPDGLPGHKAERKI